MANINKILLIQPPNTIIKGRFRTSEPPLGLGYIAAVLEAEGCNVDILDAAIEGYEYVENVDKRSIYYGLPFAEIKKRIELLKPDVVGVSCLFSPQHKNSIGVCKLAKEVNSNIITVLGGHHPSVFAKEILSEEEDVDFIIKGEGEYPFRELLKRLKESMDYSDIDGLAFRKNEKIYDNPKTKFIDDLDELPFPLRKKFQMEKYFKINIPQGVFTKENLNTSVITSRGCSARCIFCATVQHWGRRFRARSAENVLTEIDELVERYGIKEIRFLDDNLTLDRDRALKLFSALAKRPYKLFWSTPQGVATWTLDEELLAVMKQSGCYRLTLGIESGDQNVLHKIIKKPVDLQRVTYLIKIMRRLGIGIDAFFVIGFPGETKAQIQKTFDFAWKNNIDSVYFQIVTPLPGTELYRIAKEKGYLINDYSFETIDYSIANIQTPDFTAREIEKMVAKQTLVFHLALIFRNPFEFIRRYVMFLFRHPMFLLNYVLNLGILRLFNYRGSKQ